MGTKQKKFNVDFKDTCYLWFVTPVLILLIVIIWFLPIEEKTNLINNPNQKGTTNFKGGDYSVNIDGGFLYRIDNKNDLPAELTIKKDAPFTSVRLATDRNRIIRLNILNTSINSDVYVNGELKKISLYPTNQKLKEQIDLNQLPKPNVVKSNEYLDDPKGAFVEVDLHQGDNNIFISSKNSNNDLKFLVASDFHSGYTVGFNGFMQMIKANPDFIVLNGDIVDFGNKAEYIVAGGFTEASPVPIYTTIGNHENWQSGAKFYQSYFGPLTKSFTYKNSLFVFLDDHTGYISNQQFNWLNSVLAGTKAQHKFVFAHMPAIDAHTGVFDSHTYRYPQNRHNIYSKEQSDHLITLLNQYKVDALFSGHDHVYNNIKLGNVVQVNSGAVGGKVRKVDNITYLETVVNGSNVQINNIPVIGANGAFNKEHASKIKLIATFAKPYFSDKKIRLALTVALIAIFVSAVIAKQYLLKKFPLKLNKKR